MEIQSVEDANDLLKNGILVETNKGLVCMSLNDALSSNLNLSVEDLQNVAAQLLLQQTKTEKAPETEFESDGFTSESSDFNIGMIPISSTESTSFVDSKTESENVSSNVSDSDTNLNKLNEIFAPDECHKLPAKKRGGWPKGRKRKPELLHLPPKAPATGYNLFLNDQRKLLKDSNLLFHEKTKLIGNKWSSLTLEEKRPYLDKAEEEKRRYREEFKQYRQSGAYQLYLANKRRKRATYNNVLSESDMDATDDIDDEDNEELYCRTCDQWFHNLHNKREHLLGRQHQQSIAGAISKELNSDCDTDVAPMSSCLSFSTSLDESSLDAMPSTSGNKINPGKNTPETVAESISNLLTAVSQREIEIQVLKRKLQDTQGKNAMLLQELCSLKEVETSMQKTLALLQEQEKEMETTVYNLWQVPSFFVMTEFDTTNEEYNL